MAGADHQFDSFTEGLTVFTCFSDAALNPSETG
jgi:hypothetical protein